MKKQFLIIIYSLNAYAAFPQNIDTTHQQDRGKEYKELAQYRYFVACFPQEQDIECLNDSVYGYQWDTISLNWEHTSKRFYTFNEANKYLSQTNLGWDGITWANVYHRACTYDANYNLINDLNQNGNNSTWTNNFQFNITYDANNNQTYLLYQNWQDTAWVNNSQYYFTYTEDCMTSTWLRQNWNGLAWENDEIDTSKYDTQGNLITTVRRGNWDGTQWNGYLLYSYTYDSNNNRISKIHGNSAWPGETLQHTIYTYDANNNLIDELQRNYLGGSGTLYASYRDIYTYDSNNNQLSHLYQKTIPFDTVLVNYRLSNFTYDINNNLTTSLGQVWNDSVWVNSSREDYFGCHLINGIKDQENHKDQIKIYPNPSKGTFNIEANGFDIETNLQLFNTLGQLIWQDIAEVGQLSKGKEVNIQNLNRGIYFMHFNTATGQTTKKLLIE